MRESLEDDNVIESAWQDARLAARIAAEIVPHVEYRLDPIGWARDKLGIPEHTLKWSLNRGYADHEWDGTVDPLHEMFTAVARGERAVAVESGTGTGKSYAAAVLVLWFLACWKDALVITHALTADQLKLFIWRNITELWPRFAALFPSADLTDLTLRMRGGIDETWAAHGRPVQLRAGETVATRAAGYHAPDMLIVYEEAAGQDWSVMEAGRNTCTSPHNIRVALGNPNHQLDSLHRFAEEPGTIHIRVSALDHPNVVTHDPAVIPGAVSVVSIDERRSRFGETDPVFLSRVRGVSPEQASNALIQLKWLKAAAARWEARVRDGEVLPRQMTGMGVDVANSEHGDRACTVEWYGNVWRQPRAFPCPDANVLGSSVVAQARKADLDPWRVGIDAIGVGAGTVNEARRLGFMVQALYAGGSPMKMIEKTEDGKRVEWSPDVNLFDNLRGQMYWQAREDLRLGRVDGPADAELWQELTSVTFRDENKVVKIDPKDDIRKLLGRSPDKADAWVMGNWVRKRQVKPPETPAVPQGHSAGYDYKERKPRDKVSADREMEMMLARLRPQSMLGDRYSIPNRRGR